MFELTESPETKQKLDDIQVGMLLHEIKYLHYQRDFLFQMLRDYELELEWKKV